MREYLNAAQLAALTPWSVTAIEKKVRRGELVRGVHYFQPGGAGSQLLFKWSAIVALIEGEPAPATAAVPAAKGKVLDVAEATRGIHRLLGRSA